MRKLRVVKRWILLVILVGMLTGCGIWSEEKVKVGEPEFTILAEEKIPEELMSIMEEKKKEPFKLTYSDRESLYICIGYGEQVTGGYSIAVRDLYLTESSIYVSTELLGPEQAEKGQGIPSFPFIVLKMPYSELPVIFQ